MRMRHLVLSSLAIASLAIALPALGQEATDPIDPVEDKALHEEAQARFDEALVTFRQAFDACVKEAKSGAPGARERNLARAEVLLEKIDALTDRITKQKDSEKFLAGYDSAALGPVPRALRGRGASLVVTAPYAFRSPLIR